MEYGTVPFPFPVVENPASPDLLQQAEITAPGGMHEIISIPDETIVRELFSAPQGRPRAEDVAKLIANGLTEEQLVTAAAQRDYRLPVMDRTLQDLDTILPHMLRFTTKLHERYGDAVLLFAACDADPLHDLSSVIYPDQHNVRLPASQTLVYSPSLHDPVTARRFLAHYGLDEAAVMDPSRQYVLVDSGFEGSVGEALSDIAERAYGDDTMLRDDRIQRALLCAAPSVRHRQLVDVPYEPGLYTPELLPRLWSGWLSSPDLLRDYGSAGPVATALQLMPRYHGHFEDIDHSAERLELLASYTPPRSLDDIDIPSHYFGSHGGENATIVHPLAAAIVQYRVVKTALDIV